VKVAGPGRPLSGALEYGMLEGFGGLVAAGAGGRGLQPPEVGGEKEENNLNEGNLPL